MQKDPARPGGADTGKLTLSGIVATISRDTGKIMLNDGFAKFRKGIYNTPEASGDIINRVWALGLAIVPALLRHVHCMRE